MSNEWAEEYIRIYVQIAPPLEELWNEICALYFPFLLWRWSGFWKHETQKIINLQGSFSFRILSLLAPILTMWKNHQHSCFVLFFDNTSQGCQNSQYPRWILNLEWNSYHQLNTKLINCLVKLWWSFIE